MLFRYLTFYVFKSDRYQLTGIIQPNTDDVSVKSKSKENFIYGPCHFIILLNSYTTTESDKVEIRLFIYKPNLVLYLAIILYKYLYLYIAWVCVYRIKLPLIMFCWIIIRNIFQLRYNLSFINEII